MSKAWANGSSMEWRRMRAFVLQRDNGECQIRIKGVCTGHATNVHHTLGRLVTGDDPDFLVAACRACNLKIGDPTKLPDPPPRPVTRW